MRSTYSCGINDFNSAISFKMLFHSLPLFLFVCSVCLSSVYVSNCKKSTLQMLISSRSSRKCQNKTPRTHAIHSEHVAIFARNVIDRRLGLKQQYICANNSYCVKSSEYSETMFSGLSISQKSFACYETLRTYLDIARIIHS